MFGQTLQFATIQGLLVRNVSANLHPLQVLRPTANGAVLFLDADDGIQINPGGLFLVIAGDGGATQWTVTDATADLLRIENMGAASILYDIVLIGKGV